MNSEEFMKMVGVGDYDVVFYKLYLNRYGATFSREGIRLPQKVTYFHPKLLSGLFINKFGK